MFSSKVFLRKEKKIHLRAKFFLKNSDPLIWGIWSGSDDSLNN
jgi:hypothetical protein